MCLSRCIHPSRTGLTLVGLEAATDDVILSVLQLVLLLVLGIGMFVSVLSLVAALFLEVGGMVLQRHNRMQAFIGTAVSAVVLVVAWYTYVWPHLSVFIYG